MVIFLFNLLFNFLQNKGNKMTDNRQCYSILLLIDNTATMNKCTFESFPFISFAKSIVKLIVERSRQNKIRLIVAYSDPNGKPKSIILNLFQPSLQFPNEISHLEVSPSGFFDETVKEGFIQFGKMRYQKELADPYFLPKKNDFYSIMLFTDGWGLSRDFYKFQAANEWLIRPDVSIYFCNICHSDQANEKTNLNAKFSDACRQIDMEFIPFYSPYSGTNNLMSKIFCSTYYFHFNLNIESVIYKAKIPITNFIWPLPYDPIVNEKENILPEYYCIYLERTANVKRIKYTKHDVFAKLDDAKYGNYIVYDNADDGTAFAILVYEKDHISLKLLPYNFLNLLQIMNPIPSKNACDEYLNNLPPPYYEGVTTFFKECQFEFSSNPPKTKKEYLTRLRNREEFYNNHITDNYSTNTKSFLDPSRFSEKSLRAMLEMMPRIRTEFSVKKTFSKITISNDTIDDEKNFQSLEIVRPKYHSAIIYQRTQSPVHDNFIRSIMPKSKVTTTEEQILEVANTNEIIENLFEDESETDDITMLEDLLMLLRDREISELERRLKKMKENIEFFSFVKVYLLNSIKRFKIENLPNSFLALLNASNN